MKSQLIVGITLLLISYGMLSHAGSTPRSLAADKHIKAVSFDPNNVVHLKGRYGYQIEINFSPSETIQNVAIGDSMAWQAVPVNNSLFVKPIAESNTNMTVLTNVNSYNFELDSTDQNASPTYKMQFSYPGTEARPSIAHAGLDPAKINLKYCVTGYKKLVPIEVFDNGQFTFFKFNTEGSNRLPSIYIVDENEHESLVNYHVQGAFVVVNAVAGQFNLRDGDYLASVYNDLMQEE